MLDKILSNDTPTEELTPSAAPGVTSGEDAPSEEPPELSEADLGILFTAIEQMTNLLADPKMFKSNISKKVAEKQLPIEWNDVVEILPEAALLQQVGEDWHWRFDINANPLQVPEPGAGPTGLPASPPMQPAPLEPGQVAYVEDQIKPVEQVNAAISAFTEDRLNLEHLGGELRLVPISPTYSSFQACASSYRAHAGSGPMEQTYPSLPSEKAVLQEYSNNLKNSRSAIKRALFLAEFLAIEKDPEPSSRLRTSMLRLIAADLDFQSLTAAQIDALLAEFKNEFESNEQGIVGAFAVTDDDSTPLDPAWVVLLQKLLAKMWSAVHDSPPPSGQPDLIDYYFSNRAKAIVLHTRHKQRLKRLSLRELRVRAVLDLPAFHGDPDAIHLLDYANALAAALKYPQPAALCFLLAVLIKLGFGKQVRTLAIQFAPTLGGEQSADLAEAAGTGQRSGERVFLILGGPSEERVPGDPTLVLNPKSQGSYAADWTISKTNAVFPIHVSDLQGLRQSATQAAYSLVNQLEISLEIQDEGVHEFFLGPQVRQGALGSVGVGKPTNLDDAVASVRKNYPA